MFFRKKIIKTKFLKVKEKAKLKFFFVYLLSGFYFLIFITFVQTEFYKYCKKYFPKIKRYLS